MFVGYDDGERLIKVSSGRTGNSVFEDTGVIASKKKAKGGSMLAILKSGALSSQPTPEPISFSSSKLSISSSLTMLTMDLRLMIPIFF